MTKEQLKEMLDDIKTAHEFASSADTIAFRLENEIDVDEHEELWNLVTDADELLLKAMSILDKAVYYIEEAVE